MAENKEVNTIEEMIKALPGGVKVGDSLFKNLITLGLAVKEMVVIAGVKDGILISENTPKGNKSFIDSIVEDMNKKLGHVIISRCD